MRFKRLVYIFAVVVPLVLASGVAATTGWMVIPSPSPGASGNELNAVAVLAANDAWAVGDLTAGNGADQTLVERWNGMRWGLVPSPNPSVSHNVLTGVATVSPSEAWAVGWFDNPREVPRTLIEHWDGTAWRFVTSPDVGTGSNFLYAITAVSTDDVWAVGQGVSAQGAGQTLTLHWDGLAWSVVPSPNVGTRANVLNGVTAVSTNDIWAVGDSFVNSTTTQTLVEHWGGVAWSVVPSPNGASGSNVLNAVSAIGADDAWAVGQAATTTLTEHWDGLAWRVVPSPNVGADNSLLRGVAAKSPTNVWAVGWDVAAGTTLIERWNGTTWAIVQSPNPSATLNVLNGVAASPASGATWAVGTFFGSTGSQTLIEAHP